MSAAASAVRCAQRRVMPWSPAPRCVAALLARQNAASRVSAAAAARRCFGLKARHRGTVYVPRLVARKTLEKATRRHPDHTLLLPPYISAPELRILFRLDYASTFRLLGVKYAQSKYFWQDYDGREYETTSKRKVLVPFELAAVPVQGLGLSPRLVDVEPDWSLPDAPAPSVAPVPVVAVLGHINHGKTTLLDALCGTAIAPSEPGGITQGVRAMTWQFGGPEAAMHAPCARGLPYSSGCRSAGRVDPEHMTFLDTPGHEAFELQRGRTMAAADAALVVVSVERGAEVQTEEVLMHAARWRVPIVFALNKIDLPTAHLDLTRAELRRQCQRLYEQGLVDVDWTREAEAAVPISALHRRNLDGLVAQLCEVLEGLPRLPAKLPEPLSCTPGEGRACRQVHRRTDFLVGVDAPPSAVALVVEVERGAETGEQVLTLIVRMGRLVVGQFFVAGTAFGRITHLGVARGGEGSRQWHAVESATAGMAVQVMGLRTRSLGGDCAPDDLLIALPRERAWRLSEHRRRIEELSACQAAGPPLDVAWEHDPMGLASRTQAAFERKREDQPEKHSASAFERRWQQAAIDEVAPDAAPEDIPTDGRGPRPPFRGASRREFQAPLGSTAPSAGTANHSSDSEGEVAVVGVEKAAPEAEPTPRPATGGRRSAAARRRVSVEELDDAAASSVRGDTRPDESARRFQVLQPAVDEGEPEVDAVDGGGGRRSARRGSGRPERLPSGAWMSNRAPEKEFIYYVDRESFAEEADIDTTRLRSRWRWRDRARWDEERRKEELVREEKKLAEKTRREVFGEPPVSSSDDEAESDADPAGQETDRREVEPLPRRNMPVVPMILKTRTVGQFDMLMDEVERVQDSYGVRVVIVHGGLGPVIPKDIVHAEVEKQYGYCPIYAFQVGTVPPAVGQAEAEQIDIRRFDVFTDLVGDVAGRCEKLRADARLARYTESLKQQPTHSGL